MIVQVDDLVEEARKFINYDRSTKMTSGGVKSKRASLVERLADEVERMYKSDDERRFRISDLIDENKRLKKELRK